MDFFWGDFLPNIVRGFGGTVNEVTLPTLQKPSGGCSGQKCLVIILVQQSRECNPRSANRAIPISPPHRTLTVTKRLKGRSKQNKIKQNKAVVCIHTTKGVR